MYIFAKRGEKELKFSCNNEMNESEPVYIYILIRKLVFMCTNWNTWCSNRLYFFLKMQSSWKRKVKNHARYSYKIFTTFVIFKVIILTWFYWFYYFTDFLCNILFLIINLILLGCFLCGQPLEPFFTLSSLPSIPTQIYVIKFVLLLLLNRLVLSSTSCSSNKKRWNSFFCCVFQRRHVLVKWVHHVKVFGVGGGGWLYVLDV